jgi:hypothetical protein
VSALAFTLVALLLVGPVPELLARASWPTRAPRAAIVLWQAVAVAAVLSAFSAGIAIASRLLVPGPDGRPTATITSEIRALGLPLWLAYVTVFAITLLIGARLLIAVLQVSICSGWPATVPPPPGPATFASSTSPSRWPTACPACEAAWS